MWEASSPGGEGEELEDCYPVWALRAAAAVCLLAGLRGAAEFSTSAAACPRAPELALFWRLVEHLGGAWLALDVAACAFCLRCLWPASRVGRFARAFALCLWCLAIFGLAQYSFQLGQGGCWGLHSVLVAVVLMLYALSCLLWCLLVDCDSVCCQSLGEAGIAPCGLASLVELREWPACGEDSDEEAARPEPGASVAGARWGPTPPAAGAARTAGSAASGSSGGPAPMVLGKSHVLERPEESPARKRLRGEIRVLRGGLLLHVGRTRRGVRRWLRRHLQDMRGVTVEDSTGRGPDASVPRPRRGTQGTPPAGLLSPSRRAGTSPPASPARSGGDSGRSAMRPQVPPLDLAGLQ